MKVFVSNDFPGHWVGTAAVVVARDRDRARALLKQEIKAHGLPRRGDRDQTVSFRLTEVNLLEEDAIILQDGDY